MRNSGFVLPALGMVRLQDCESQALGASDCSRCGAGVTPAVTHGYTKQQIIGSAQLFRHVKQLLRCANQHAASVRRVVLGVAHFVDYKSQ
jgi:hypothetical protein